MTASSPGWASFPIWGSRATIASADPERLGAVRQAVDEVLDTFDRACSRFRDDSELTALNARAGQAVEVSPLLLECLRAALRAAELTGGLVDPTVGEALIALGYDRDYAALAAGRDATAVSGVRVASVPGWRAVHIDPDSRTVTAARGVRLDLGATAKALAADHAAAAASERAGCGALVSLGGDLAIAGDGPSDGWPVRVTDDHRSDADAPGQWIRIGAGGLATSSTTTRRWDTAAGPAHHLIDPSTGRSATAAWRTVSVCAADCLDANTASTAAIIRGAGAAEWLEALRLPSRLVSSDGDVQHVAGWPEAGDDLPDPARHVASDPSTAVGPGVERAPEVAA